MESTTDWTSPADLAQVLGIGLREVYRRLDSGDLDGRWQGHELEVAVCRPTRRSTPQTAQD